MLLTTYHECPRCGTVCEDRAPCCPQRGRPAGGRSKASYRRRMALPLVGSLALLLVVGWVVFRHQLDQPPDDDFSATYRINTEYGWVVMRDAKTHERLVTCLACKGKGRHKDRQGKEEACTGCGGSGMMTERAARLWGKPPPPWWQLGW